MNKIKILNNDFKLSAKDNNLEISFEKSDNPFMLDTLKIKAIKSTSVEIDFNSSNSKLDVNIEVLKDVNLDYFEFRNPGIYKARYKYFVNENANINITKFYNFTETKEMNIIYLLEEKAKVNYLHKVLNSENEKIDLYVEHLASKTESNVNCHGVNILNGLLNFSVTTKVIPNVKDAKANQFSRIINQTDNVCVITPNLLIEGNTSEAEHSAYVGSFSDEELFYLNTRGVSKKNAEKLLIDGFITDGIKDEEKLLKIKNIINKKWR